MIGLAGEGLLFHQKAKLGKRKLRPIPMIVPLRPMNLQPNITQHTGAVDLHSNIECIRIRRRGGTYGEVLPGPEGVPEAEGSHSFNSEASPRLVI